MKRFTFMCVVGVHLWLCVSTCPSFMVFQEALNEGLILSCFKALRIFIDDNCIEGLLWWLPR